MSDAVAGAEAHIVGELVGIYLILSVGQVALAPYAEDGDEEDYREDEVEKHAAGHNEKPLPGRFAAELPGLGVVGKVFRVHRLVHHPVYLAVAAQRQPADAIFGLAVLQAGEEAGEPAFLGAQQLEAAGIEEHKELVDPDSEKLGEGEMPQLVEEDEDGEDQDDLQCLDKRYHSFSFAFAYASPLVARMSSREGLAMKDVSAIASSMIRDMS